MPKRRLILSAAALVVVLLSLAGANTWRNAARLQPLSDTPEARLTLLSRDWRLVLPEGPGPFPALILLSGCDGVHDNMDHWASRAVAQGRAALIVNSHRPRGLDQMQAWRTVCAGQILTGAERAGDIATAMAAIARMPRIDGSDIGILGASHGGWAAMEYLDLLGEGTPPPGLTDWPAPPAELAARLGPVVLLYPYCGLLSGAGDARWPAQVRGLMILGDKDSVTDPRQCRDMARKLSDHGATIKVVTLKDADHGFDQKDRSVLSSLRFDAGLTASATALVDGFLTAFAARDPAL